MEQVVNEEFECQSWEEQLGDVADESALCDSIPDFIVANIKKLKETENTTLRQIAQKYTFPLSYDEVRDLCRLKMKFQNDDQYFSMSMPQLGYPKRGIIYFMPKYIKKIEPKDKHPTYMLLNPTYEPVEGTEVLVDYEKCASVKNLCGLVPRYNEIRYKAYNPFGELEEGVIQGHTARCIQHEIDHLNGLLFIDKAQHIITIKEHRWRRSIGKLQFLMDI